MSIKLTEIEAKWITFNVLNIHDLKLEENETEDRVRYREKHRQS